MDVNLQELGKQEVLDENGNTISLSSLWQDQRAVLIFVRHFGCLFCRQQVTELIKYIKDFEDRKAQVVVIGNGAPNFIKGFRQDMGYEGKLYTDPSLKTYNILAFKRSVGSLLGWKSLKEGIRALGSGHLQTNIQGDTLQQGGAVIVGPGSILHYVHRNKEAGDHPPIKEMLNACKV